MNFTNSNVFKLDLSKWRCGGIATNISNFRNSLGTHQTLMYNPYEDKMCCLGQQALQCGVGLKDLINTGHPGSVSRKLGFSYDIRFCRFDSEKFGTSKLTAELIKINDDPRTSIETKIELMRQYLEKEGITLEVTGWEWLEEQRKLNGITANETQS